MDKKIKAIAKNVKVDAKKEGKQLSSLLKEDKKHDKKLSKCDMMMKKKK